MKKILLSLAVAFSVLSCQKDISADMSNPQVGTPKFNPSPVSGSIAGVIVNENDVPVANATVSVGASVYTTDNRGMFKTNALTLDKYITTVKAEKAGYFTAYRSFSANATKNYVAIKLVPKTLAGSFASSSTGNITLSNGSAVSFQANSVVVKSTGAAYSGNVRVYASYIDPTTTDFGAVVPGSLMAEDANNFYALRSTGMMAVEMESDAGVALQLATAKPATMKMAIPTSLLSKAPATIDTWSLDNRGIWIKEGTATRNGNVYDFSVSHFSFWNCDVPTTAVYLTVNVKDQNNNNYVNTPVSLTSSTTFGTTWGHTDSLGNVSGMVPKNEALVLRVYAGYAYGNCNAFFSQTVGPFNATSSINIVAALPASNSVTLTGTAVNCSGAAVQSGTIFIYAGLYQRVYTFTNGSFNLLIPTCVPLTAIDVIVVDNIALQQSSTASFTVSGGTVNTGAITVCGTSSNEFITYIVDGTTYNITADSASAFYLMSGGATTFISAYSPQTTNTNRISFSVTGTSVGTYDVANDSLQVNNYQNALSQPGSTATFTSYGTAVGQFVEGTFNIPFASMGAVHTLTGSFRLRRD